jgi:hypothetical protein
MHFCKLQDDIVRTVGLALCFMSAGPCSAGSINDLWLGGSGAWSGPAAWSAGIPNNNGSTTYAVTVASGGTDQVTLDTSFVIDSLAIGGSTGSSLVQSGPGSLTPLVGGALTVSQAGSISLSSGDAMTVGSAVSAGSINVSTGASLGVTGDLTNSNYLNVAGSSALAVGGNLNNQGTLNSYGALTVGGTLSNQSTTYLAYLGIDSGTANVNAISNAGEVYIGGGTTLNLTGGGPGVTDIAAGASYSVSGTFNVINGGARTSALANLATVEGGLTLEDGQTTTTAASLNNSGGMTVWGSGTTLAVTRDLTNSGSATMWNGGTLTTTGNLTNSGHLIVDGSSALAVGGNLNNQGFLESYGALTLGGTLNNQSTGSLYFYGGTANVNAISNAGEVSIGGGSTLNLTGGGPGVTDIAAGATYAVVGNFNSINGAVTTGALANLARVEGWLDLQNGQTTTTVASLNNSGGIAVVGIGTTLAITGDLTNSGNVDVGSGGTLTTTGDLTNSGIVNADGALLVGSDAPADTGYDQLADGTLAEGIISGSDFGSIFSNGPATLAGTLDVLLQGGFDPSIGETFVILSFAPGTLNGTFSSIGYEFFNNDTEQWAVTYDNAGGQVFLTAEAAQFTQTPEPPTALLICSCLLTAAYRVRWHRTRRRVR